MKQLIITYKHLFTILCFVLLSGCGKTNWTENYREKEKSPFGTYIIYNEVDELLKNEEVIYLKENFYDYLYKNQETTKADFGTYICIKNDAYKLTGDGIDALLSFVASGNNAFLSLNEFSENLREKLEITTNNLDKNVSTIEDLRPLKGEFYLKNENLKTQAFIFDRNIRRHYFVTYNENKTIVLGSAKIDGEKVPNFMKIYHGKGAIYVHANPVVFTNYYLLKDKEQYTENVFSYLPSSTLLWDPQIKKSEYSNQPDKDNESVFKFFLQHETLTWFLFVSLVGILLFMLFNARRKQRAIPIILPLENTTVAFTQTISSLYLKEEDHKNLVDKKIAFFLEKVRTKYLLNTNILNKNFIHHLAAKSDNKIQNTKYLINTIITLNKRFECTQEELLVLHKMIDNFFKKKADGNTK
ncbi:DUF4350 domain-containing protein [Polaribacter sp. IC063]|uniref:DUF4350 domain-containing protein n=1 Tax=Polaribacter sp. IC063 TaxID=57031 RepID=UPI0011BDD377|nr:DUF4350 domain-containing protein [Polaribacter sp. IC063]TXD50712.1 hypothetical protein ES043_15080 [Polaribacter sp. IC063]